LKRTGNPITETVRNAALLIAKNHDEKRFLGPFQTIEETLKSTHENGQKLHGRFEGLYSRAAAHEKALAETKSTIESLLTQHREAIAEMTASAVSVVSSLSAEVKKIDERQRLMFSILTAVAFVDGSEQRAFAIRNQIKLFQTNRSKDHAMALLEMIVARGERAAAQVEAAKK
jgi:hypothetical protein